MVIILKIDAKKLSYKILNEKIRTAIRSGEKELILENVNGQRYIGDNLDDKVTIHIDGVPGNDLAFSMDGPNIFVKGNGQEGIRHEETKSPFKFIGILDITSLETWKKVTQTSKAFAEEFSPQWFSNWVADFYTLSGEEVYDKESD